MKRLSAVLLMMTVAAAEAAATTEFRSIHQLPGASRRIDLDLVDASVVDAFRTFATVLGAELEFDSSLDGLVTARLERVTVATAIRAVSESLDLHCGIRTTNGGPPVLFVEPAGDGAPARPRTAREPRNTGTNQLISLSFAGAALEDVLRSFGRVLEAEVDAPNLEGGVVLELQNAPASDALDQICRQFDLTWRIVEEPGSETRRRRLEIRKIER